MRRIYVASSWRNQYQQEVVSVLRRHGNRVFDFRNPNPGNHGFHWSEIDTDWETWSPQDFRKSLNHPIADSGYLSDFEAMKWADTCVLVLPCGHSAHLEAGWFAGAKKETYILMFEPGGPELMYKMATKICVSLDELIIALKEVT